MALGSNQEESLSVAVAPTAINDISVSTYDTLGQRDAWLLGFNR